MSSYIAALIFGFVVAFGLGFSARRNGEGWLTVLTWCGGFGLAAAAVLSVIVFLSNLAPFPWSSLLAVAAVFAVTWEFLRQLAYDQVIRRSSAIAASASFLGLTAIFGLFW